MPVVTLIAVLLTLIVVHEAAHALALRRLGIPISEAGLGLPIPPVLRWKPRRLPFTLAVSPWLLGAYVRPDPAHEDRLDALPYRDAAWFTNAGIVANLLAFAGLLAVDAAMSANPILAVLAAVAAVVLWLGRKPVAAYLLPALALPALVFMAAALAISWKAGSTGAGFAGLAEFAPHGFQETVRVAGVMSLALAALNALPLFGLDNGRVVGILVHRWLGCAANRMYEYAGLAAVAALLVLAVGSDLWAVGTAVLR